MLARLLERAAVPQSIVRRIHAMIADGTVRPGERLPPQRELASTLNVSRASLREALSVLETTGFIRIEPGRGAVVCEPEPRPFLLHQMDRHTADEIFQVRLLIETYATRLAATRISASARDQIRQHNEAMRQALRGDDVDKAAAADLALHRAIIEASGNELLVQIHDTLQETMLASHLIPLSDPKRRWEPIGEHEQVLKALELHDPESAFYYMRLHLVRTAGRSGIDEVRCSAW